MALFEAYPVGLKDYVRVENTPTFIEVFKHLYSQQTDVLYNHSRIYPFAYLSLGQMKLYLNKDYNNNNIIPVVRKHELTLEHAPSFTIHCPLADYSRILAEVNQLDQHSSSPVDITDVTKDYAEKFVAANPTWKKIKTSDDVIQQADKLAKLEGRNFSSLRNTLKHVREDLKPEVQPLNERNSVDAICVFENWKRKQGVKYFRVTIGRDTRLIQEYCDKMDFVNLFSYIFYINGIPKAVSFGCRSFKDPTWGQDITVKADIDCKGLGDYAFVYLLTEMNKKGIILVNDSGGTGNVRLNKIKYRPLKDICMYDLQRLPTKLTGI